MPRGAAPLEHNAKSYCAQVRSTAKACIGGLKNILSSIHSDDTKTNLGRTDTKTRNSPLVRFDTTRKLAHH